MLALCEKNPLEDVGSVSGHDIIMECSEQTIYDRVIMIVTDHFISGRGDSSKH